MYQLIFILIYFTTCVILTTAWAVNKRVGDGWGFFFLFFWGVLPGIIVISASPSKKRLKELKDGFYGLDKPLGIIGIILAALDVLAIARINERLFISPEEKNWQMVQYVLLFISFIGLAIYMFGRFKRHERIFNKLNNPSENT